MLNAGLTWRLPAFSGRTRLEAPGRPDSLGGSRPDEVGAAGTRRPVRKGLDAQRTQCEGPKLGSRLITMTGSYRSLHVKVLWLDTER